MTTWTERLPVEDITRQAREVRPVRTLLTWLAGLLFAIGWVAYKVVAVAWLAGAWSFVAARDGWRAARRTQVTRGPGRPG